MGPHEEAYPWKLTVGQPCSCYFVIGFHKYELQNTQ